MRRVKKKVRKKLYFFGIVFLLASIGCFCTFVYFKFYPIEIVLGDVDFINGIVEIDTFNAGRNSYCAVVSSEISQEEINEKDWKIISDDVCKCKVSNSGEYSVYIKNYDGIKKLDVNETLSFSLLKSKYYLALNDTADLKIKNLQLGSGSVSVKSLNEKVVKIKNNAITAVGKGSAKVVVSDGDVEKEVSVVVTDLINPIPREYNYDRNFLSCGVYSEKEAKLLDEVLAFRVKEAGEGTRAGVVAAARFLTLEFPYRITYFSENGRLGNYSGGPKVDGEGRFYHKGLYLTESKFDVLDSEYIDKGPATWGCSMFSRPSDGVRANGLDCSGFTTWVVYNGGFDIEDLAAHGGDSSIYDLNDIGEEVMLTNEIAMSDKIKAGDLLGEVTVSEGHSAIVVGVDKNNYYVAESLWIAPLGVNINTYKKSKLADSFETVNLMDSYYKKQGNYTAMWR